MNKIRGYNNGITIISLVITIIIMLILASVTVNVVINGGLFNYAGKTKENIDITKERETLQEAILIAESQSKTGRVTVEEMQKAINSVVVEENTATAINNGDTIAVKFDNSNRYYFIDNEGNVEGPVEITYDSTPGELDGTGTEEDPFVIMSMEDFLCFSQNVAQYKNKYVALGKTIDFKSDLSYVNPNTTEYDEYLGGDGTTGLKEQLTEGLGFMPINNFSGTFDGQNNWIKNIYINRDSNNVALFGTSSYITIKNLNASGEITGLANVGGFFGRCPDSGRDVKIINCNNYINIKGTTCVGGIAGYGYEVSVEDCDNYGAIKGEESLGQNVGGIVGAYAKITKSTNYVEIYGTNYVAGICGNANSAKIFECVNTGKVKGDSYVGGICGTSGNAGIAERCYNTGQITGETNVGGIAGHHYRRGKMQCVYNSGEIIGVENVGGIAGDCSNDYNRNPISSKCYNIGKVTGTTNVGQIIGKLSTATSAYYEKMYYLNTISSKGIGNMDDIEGVVEGKTSAELKADDLLSILNESHTHNVDGTDIDYTANCWVKDTNNINSGYPILSY